MDTQVCIELPQYECYKKVHAAKITVIEEGVMVFGDIGGSICIGEDWIERFKPEVGGYYVVYKDGYTSFSPAKAFEEGYKKL